MKRPTIKETLKTLDPETIKVDPIEESWFWKAFRIDPAEANLWQEISQNKKSAS